ncbi:MAG: hypothetical protein ACRDJE_17565 [Dehalococcoidia bacterium]
MILGAFEINTSGELALFIMTFGVLVGAAALTTLVLMIWKDW